MKDKYKYFFKRLLYYFYGEKFYKRLDYDWSQHPTRTEIIQKFINKTQAVNYLEIGCDTNANFSKIKVKNKIGVDPNSGGTHRMTSDEFFKDNQLKFDVIFLDGLHTYQQTIKDIQNSIKHIQDKGIIFIHDCLPKKIWNQLVPRLYGHWNGDVWKAIVEARTYDEIDTFTCIADHGIGIILKRANTDKLIFNKNVNFANLKFADYFKNHKLFMRTVKTSELDNIIL